MIGTLNNVDKPQAATTKALALHPAIKVEFSVLSRFVKLGYVRFHVLDILKNYFRLDSK